MADFNQLPFFTDAHKFRRSLADDGWRTPDTYTSDQFEPLITGSAIYLLLLYQQVDYTSALVAYVGQSINLRQRLGSHEVLAELNAPGLWVMRWFKTTQPSELRCLEREYIRRFNPPWNIIGRPRGVVVS